MRNLFSSRYMDALAKTIFFFGIFHLNILAYISAEEGLQVLNAFKILNLDSFIPSLGQGAVNFVLSYLMVLVIYGLVYLGLTDPKNESG